VILIFGVEIRVVGVGIGRHQDMSRQCVGERERCPLIQAGDDKTVQTGARVTDGHL
jgi:hypothetical protein